MQGDPLKVWVTQTNIWGHRKKNDKTNSLENRRETTRKYVEK